MTNEIMSFVRAHDLVREHAGGGDHTEDIVVHEVPREQAAGWLLDKMRQGYSIDPKMFEKLYFLITPRRCLSGGLAVFPRNQLSPSIFPRKARPSISSFVKSEMGLCLGIVNL
jgi:hypothetical protein